MAKCPRIIVWQRIQLYVPLTHNVSSTIKPIFSSSKNVLLEWCVGCFMKNNNESQIVDLENGSKILPAGSKIVEIAAIIAASTFNGGILALLMFLHDMIKKIGRNSHKYAGNED